jgi:hypothetical protein
VFWDRGHATWMTEIRNKQEILPENFNEIHPLRNLGLSGRAIGV